MTSLSSVAEVMLPVRAPLKGGFRSRLAVSSLATGLDFGVLMVVGPAAYQCAPFSWMVPVAFSIFALGAFVSLGHIWLLTIQSWNCQ
jgi:hypothetical protein